MEPIHSGTLLLIEDNTANIGVLYNYLVWHGYRVLVALDGKSGIEKALLAEPDLILLDILLPEMDGFETCRRLKTEEKIRDIPVIFMTALSDTHYTVKGFELGAVDYVVKPINQEEVLARVKTHLELRRSRRTLEQKNEELERLNAQLRQEIELRKNAEEALQKANAMLYELSRIDPLTRLANRRSFDECLDSEWGRMASEGQTLGLILCDLDCFKSYNDQYGHQEGDACLQRVAACIEEVARGRARLVARYGGEEFALILTGTSEAAVGELAHAIRAAVTAQNISHAGSDHDERLTISIGAAVTRPSAETAAKMLFATTDQALYAAKNDGRNAVAVLRLDPVAQTTAE